MEQVESTRYGYKVVFPDSEELTQAGFGKVAHIPAIFDSEPGYARLPSRFLIDRSLGNWDPKWRGSRPNPKLPASKSIRNYAYWLCNSLEWAEARSIDLMMADYSTILIGRYQEEMLRGIWSSKGISLSEGTVNVYVQTALEFQMWSADKGYRKPFEIPTVASSFVTGSHTNSKSHLDKTVESRKGKMKGSDRILVLPDNDTVQAWRKRIYAQDKIGTTEGLMIEHILNTGIRREELACWRVDTLPLHPRDWKIINPNQPEDAQQVVVEIKFGTKGREFYIDEYGDKIGPQGAILIPLWFAKKIHRYRDGARREALKQATRGVRSPAKVKRILNQSVHLYLNPQTGKRYTGSQIYDFWTESRQRKNWSPHAGRHWWACQYLLQKMQEHSALIKQVLGMNISDVNHPLIRALRDTAQTVIQLEICPQLRHRSSRTTEKYLRWLFNQFRTSLNLTREWHEEDEMLQEAKNS